MTTPRQHARKDVPATLVARVLYEAELYGDVIAAQRIAKHRNTVRYWRRDHGNHPDVVAALGCSTPTARRLAAEWARLTASFGCTTAGAGCRCHAWPHTAVGTTTARGGRPGHAVDAEQLAAHLEALRSLDALRGELAREAA